MLSSIVNYYEHLVMDCIRDRLGKTTESLDGDFIDDLACVALNYLPARYVRFSVDLASHLSDEDRRALREEVADAVGFAMTTIEGRRKHRDQEP